ncbi:MAG: hypothetical protein RR500_07755 [Bacilli bacterium]
MNIYDLDIITQECFNYVEFIEYLDFRNQNSHIISSVDELDIFGYFKINGGGKIIIDVNELHITDYTREFDLKYKKKTHELFNQYN